MNYDLRRPKDEGCLGTSDDVTSPWPFVVAAILLLGAITVVAQLLGWGPGW
jgi:hypothetical protein